LFSIKFVFLFTASVIAESEPDLEPDSEPQLLNNIARTNLPPRSRGRPPRSRGRPPRSRGRPPRSRGRPPRSRGRSPNQRGRRGRFATLSQIEEIIGKICYFSSLTYYLSVIFIQCKS